MEKQTYSYSYRLGNSIDTELAPVAVVVAASAVAVVDTDTDTSELEVSEDWLVPALESIDIGIDLVQPAVAAAVIVFPPAVDSGADVVHDNNQNEEKTVSLSVPVPVVEIDTGTKGGAAKRAISTPDLQYQYWYDLEQKVDYPASLLQQSRNGTIVAVVELELDEPPPAVDDEIVGKMPLNDQFSDVEKIGIGRNDGEARRVGGVRGLGL